MQFWFITALFCSMTLFLPEVKGQVENCTGCHEAVCKLEAKIHDIRSKCMLTAPEASCKEIYDLYSCRENKAYPLNLKHNRTSVYCHLTELGACGGGGWTLVMKIDGTKNTFHYYDALWKNYETYNLPGGQTGFDSQETKLPTYWETPFTKICLAMKIGQQINYLPINQQADSLHSLIADGQYRATSLGRDAWKTLIGPQASLQLNCNKEGFNANFNHFQSKARIGIIADEGVNIQYPCKSPESRIGFGTGGEFDDSNTCGNEATHSPDNGNVHIKAMGYIFVQ